MQLSKRHGLEDEQIEGPRQEGCGVVVHLFS
jgi:hypothetical protein